MTPPPTNAGFDYRAFISYSHQDRAWCDWLHKALETYRVPSRLVGTSTAAGVIPRRLVPIFRDRDELPSATDLNLKVEQALGRSAALIVVCSPHAAQSRWVNEEVLAFKRMGRRDRILCLIVDGEPNASDIPGREAEECFCEALRFTVDTDGQPTDEHTEPIAADARPDKDGKANAKLKLIAGMLDVGFDALKQRELHRRNRRMVAITAAALVVMAITTTLAITAVVARHHAEVARQDALRRQKQAEGLVGFMLGDLNDKLGAVNRLDILQSVDDKAMAYFESIPSRDVTDDALALRANALQKIGAVRMNQNQLPEALKSFQAAAAINSELLERAPGDVSREAAYAASLNWIGQTYYYQGDFDHALQTFENDRDTLQRAVAQKPDDTDLRIASRPPTTMSAKCSTHAAMSWRRRRNTMRPSKSLNLSSNVNQRIRTGRPNSVGRGTISARSHCSRAGSIRRLPRIARTSRSSPRWWLETRPTVMRRTISSPATQSSAEPSPCAVKWNRRCSMSGQQ